MFAALTELLTIESDVSPAYRVVLAVFAASAALLILNLAVLLVDGARRKQQQLREGRFLKELGDGFFSALEDESRRAAWIATANRYPSGVVRSFLEPYLRIADGEYKARIATLYRELGLVAEDLQDLHSVLWHKRMMAVRRLSQVATSAEREALLACRRDTHSVEILAAQALGRIGTADDVFELLQAHGPATRLMEAPLFVLVQGLSSEHFRGLMEKWDLFVHPRVQRVLLIAAARREQAACHQWLAVAAASPLIELRTAACSAAGLLLSTESLEVLHSLLRDSHWEVRAAAARHLGTRADPVSAELLVEALSDSAFWTRQNAAAALSALGAQGKKRLDELARTSTDRFAAAAARQELQRLSLLITPAA